MSDLYLASQSPRRAELLGQIGVCFETVAIDVPECVQAQESPIDYVRRLAQSKAQAGACVRDEKPVLGADTIVVCDRHILEKPPSAEAATAMLRRLSGRAHYVLTAVSVCHGGRCESRVARTEVYFRALADTEISQYIASGEPMDKAGSYGIQGLGGIFVERIEGNYATVVGLPLVETAQLLRDFKVPYWHNGLASS